MVQPELIVIGASARAAAFSAARAGFSPWWIDQFGDADLREAFPGRRVPPRDYPRGIVDAIDAAPRAPWIYTGALENHLKVLERVAAMRPLLGNGRSVCERVRSPWLVQVCLRDAGIPFPDTPPFDSAPGSGGDWLVKPLRGAGGQGIRRLRPGSDAGPGCYVQRRLAGESDSAVFVGNGREAFLLGITRQLVGLPQFNASAFSYCGSIGPAADSGDERKQWRRIGSVLATEFRLVGIFGVDAVRAPAGITPVEVNPRYTASVEVLERALGVSAIRLHVEACEGKLPAEAGAASGMFVGKACLFAPRDLAVPDPGAWIGKNVPEGDVQIADIPAPDTRIAAGAPILTLLVRANAAETCAELLSAQARRIYDDLGV
ncbi:MAG: ATP-grasp domain-containing protein [Gammaproteobacteria bacterium]|nr:ATP-grasp domain-containing protein [Gammaproteobacteria bacterium]